MYPRGGIRNRLGGAHPSHRVFAPWLQCALCRTDEKAGIQSPIVTIGGITTPAPAEEILAAGKADIVAAQSAVNALAALNHGLEIWGDNPACLGLGWQGWRGRLTYERILGSVF